MWVGGPGSIDQFESGVECSDSDYALLLHTLIKENLHRRSFIFPHTKKKKAIGPAELFFF